MNFRFEPDRPPAEEARRVLLEQIRSGHAALAGAPTATAVHETRKAVKRTRAALALLKRSLGAAQTEPLETELKEAARTMGPVRDADALGELATKMELHLPVEAPADREARAAEAAAALGRAEQLVLELYLSDVQPEQLLRGLSRAWEKARRTYRSARQSKAPADIHEWRKATKRLLYQVELLEALNPALDGFGRLVDGLQHQLGDHHDLSVLHDVAAGDDAATHLLEGRAADLEVRAFAAGGLMFAAKPKAFARWVTSALN